MEFMRQYQRIAKFFSWWDRDKVLVKLAYKITFISTLNRERHLPFHMVAIAVLPLHIMQLYGGVLDLSGAPCKRRR